MLLIWYFTPGGGAPGGLTLCGSFFITPSLCNVTAFARTMASIEDGYSNATSSSPFCECTRAHCHSSDQGNGNSGRDASLPAVEPTFDGMCLETVTNPWGTQTGPFVVWCVLGCCVPCTLLL